MEPYRTSLKPELVPSAFLIDAAQKIAGEIPRMTSGDQASDILQSAFSTSAAKSILEFEIRQKIGSEPESPLRNALLDFTKSASRFEHLSGAPKFGQDLDREIVASLIPLLEVTESLSSLVSARFFAVNNSYELHEAITRLCNRTNCYIHAAEVAEQLPDLPSSVLSKESIRNRKDCLGALSATAEEIILQKGLAPDDRRTLLAAPLRLIGLFGTQALDTLTSFTVQATLSGDRECAGVVKNLALDSDLAPILLSH